MKFCLCMTTFQSDAASAHQRFSVIAAVSDKHVHAFPFQSVSPGFGFAVVVWFSCSRGENEWCMLLYCDVLLVKQSRPDILLSCRRLLHSSAPRVRKSTELLRHKTPDFTPDVWPPNRPDLNPIDYSDSGMHLSETPCVVIHHR